MTPTHPSQQNYDEPKRLLNKQKEMQISYANSSMQQLQQTRWNALKP